MQSERNEVEVTCQVTSEDDDERNPPIASKVDPDSGHAVEHFATWQAVCAKCF